MRRHEGHHALPSVSFLGPPSACRGFFGGSGGSGISYFILTIPLSIVIRLRYPIIGKTIQPNQSLQRIARNAANGSVVAGWAIAELERWAKSFGQRLQVVVHDAVDKLAAPSVHGLRVDCLVSVFGALHHSVACQDGISDVSAALAVKCHVQPVVVLFDLFEFHTVVRLFDPAQPCTRPNAGECHRSGARVQVVGGFLAALVTATLGREICSAYSSASGKLARTQTVRVRSPFSFSS